MKNHTTTHVNVNLSMFQDATEQVREGLLAMCDRVRDSMHDRANSIYTSMHRDYMSIIGGVNVSFKLTWQERAVRRQVDEVIDRADDYFQRVINGETDSAMKEEVHEDETGVANGHADAAEASASETSEAAMEQKGKEAEAEINVKGLGTRTMSNDDPVKDVFHESDKENVDVAEEVGSE